MMFWYPLRRSFLGLGAFLLALLLTIDANATPAAPESQQAIPFLALAYGDVTDAKLFAEQMDWLKDQNYTPVTIDDLIAAREGKKALPSKPVLLSFDGAYETFYTNAFPYLTQNKIPAVLSVEDALMKKQDQHLYLTWPQVRAIKKDPLIEIASNGHNFYFDTTANPQGDQEPIVVTLPYNVHTHHYATPQSFDTMLAENVESSAQIIARFAGARPRALAWPYGLASSKAIDIAAHHGMAITFIGSDKMASTADLARIPRMQVANDWNAKALADHIANLGKSEPMRVIQVDIDYIYDADVAQMKRNIDALIERVHALGVNAVFLQAFADPKGTELTSQTYFPNLYLPMRADLFNHIAWLLKSKDGVKVYGWIPMLSFDLGAKVTPVMIWDAQTNKAVPSLSGYHRASPFDPRAHKIIGDIFADMARYGAIDGVLYHDDALLTDFEDASPPALEAYKKAGLPDTILAIRADPAAMDKWTSFKTKALIDYTAEMGARMREFREPLLTVRNIYASLVMNIRSEEWYAQSYQQFLQAYDMTAIEAMPQMENVPDADADKWMDTLVQKAAATQSDALQKTLFELQSVDWRKAKEGKDRTIPTATLAAQMRFLTSKGALNFGYYPDDFHADVPNAAELRKDFALTP